MWYFVIVTCSIGVIMAVIYMIICVGRFGLVKELSGGKRWISIIISFTIILFVLSTLTILISALNALMIALNILFFFLLSALAVKIIKCTTNKRFKINLQGWLALSVSVVYLLIGYYLCKNVWRTDYKITTKKEFGELNIALISDSHIGTTFDGKGFAEHIKTIEKQSPDILMIAGDYVDDLTKKKDMLDACDALGKTNFKYGVWYIFGNHDEGFFNKRDFTAADLENALTRNGVHILLDNYELVDDRFYVVGRNDSSFKERKDVDEVMKGIDDSKFIIMLDHEPNDYANEAATAADLVLSGHTHGGQFFPLTIMEEWLKINDQTYGHKKINGTDFIVTSGISDGQIIFKTGTKSEYVMINISQE